MARYRVEHYRQVVVPLQEEIVRLTQEEYNYMLTGVFDLLTAKKQEFDAYGQYIAAVRDYWITRSNLQRSVGGRLPTGETAAESSTAAPAGSATPVPDRPAVQNKPDSTGTRPQTPHRH